MNASNYGIKKAQTMDIEVSDEVGLHLKELAEERELTVEELIRAMLDEYDVVRNSITLAELAENAAKARLSTPHPVDTSARSREILNNEFADYIRRHMTTS